MLDASISLLTGVDVHRMSRMGKITSLCVPGNLLVGNRFGGEGVDLIIWARLFLTDQGPRMQGRAEAVYIPHLGP